MNQNFCPKIHFPFSLDKGIAMLEYLLKGVGGSYNYMALLKVAFFADRYHVRNHARPVSMDDYIAFSYGPGGTTLKDILLEPDVVFFEKQQSIKRVSQYYVALDSPIYTDNQFSMSDIVAMNFSLECFGGIGKKFKGEFILSDISHAYPEWDKYALPFSRGEIKSKEMYYEDFLINADKNHPMFLKNGFIDPFKEISENERVDLLDEMREFSLNVFV
jgi:hypothetical protein